MDARANYLENILGDNQEAKFSIREVPHFRTCSDGLLELVYRYGRIFSLQEGESLAREGEFDQWVYFILGGKLAVLVGGEHVDTISSAMVGERCIFGDPRKATLNADQGGVTALGIDMAILDSLRGTNGDAVENVQVYIELLSIITEEIIDRVADLNYIQLDVASKLAVNIKSDEVTDIITGLIANTYSGDPQVNIAIYKFLMHQDQTLLALSLESDKITVDTKKFYSHCVNMGRPDLVLELAHTIYEIQQGGDFAADGTAGYMGRHNFHAFVHDVFKEISERNEANRAERGNGREIAESTWRERFRMGGDLRINLVQVCNWLKSAHRFTDVQVVEALVMILQLASSYTAEINKRNKEMIDELSQIKGLKKLESLAEGSEAVLSLFFDTRTPEEMIPIFSRHVLEVHLTNPYLEKLGKAAPAGSGGARASLADDTPRPRPAQKDPPPALGEGQGEKELLGSLFE